MMTYAQSRQGGRAGGDVGSGNKVTRGIRVVTELTKGGDSVLVFPKTHGNVQVRSCRGELFIMNR